MNQRFIFKGGRGDRTRTCDSLVPNQERYQLRYTSILRMLFRKALQRYCFFLTLANFSAIIFEKTSILLNNALFYEDFFQYCYRAIHLILSMRSHQCIAYEGILRCTCRRNNRVDKHTCLEG